MIHRVRFWAYRILQMLQHFVEPNQTFLKELYPQYEIGRGSYGLIRVLDWKEGATLQVGAYCSFSQNVTIFLGGEHRTDWISTYPFNQFWNDVPKIPGHPKSKGDVIIGNDVWVGYGAVILSGVHIGDGAVIGAGAIVTRDVKPYAIVAGNPAQEIRKRFQPEEIQTLLSIAWWNWPEEDIKTALPLILSCDLEGLFKIAQQPHLTILQPN